jgi:large subunit ribosomal protein L33
MHIIITLACTECKQKNYNTTKHIKKNANEKEIKIVEVTKFCRYCRKKTLHREIG